MSFFAELKRRNVVRVGIAYAVIGWFLAQVAEFAFENFDAPPWVLKSFVVLLLLGLPIALFFAWAFEMTPEGVKREKDVDRSKSITHTTGRKLDFIIIGALAVALAYFVWERQAGVDQTEPGAQTAVEGDTEVSIAVLPFVNMSSDKENEYFADGLSEELLNQLAQIPTLLVAGRTSSFSFKGKNDDLRAIGKALDVANVLEGSVRRQGDTVRVTAQLIRVADGFHLWSNNYDRTMDDVFAIQDDISANVAAAMKIVLDEPSRQRMQRAGVRNVEAFVEYQKGLELFAIGHSKGDLLETLREGVVNLDRAIAIVPEFAAAYWVKSDYYAHVILEPESTNDDRVSALKELRQVLDFAYQLSVDSSRRPMIDFDRVLFSDDWTSMQDRIEKALALTKCPDDMTWIELATHIGFEEAALEMWQQYQRCEPLSLGAATQIAYAATQLGQYELAFNVLDDAKVRLGANPMTAVTRQWLLLTQGKFEEALAMAPEVAGDAAYYGMGAEALPLAMSGDIDAARAVMEKWQAQYGRNLRVEIEIHAAMGDREQANKLAAEIDARPGGPMVLLLTTNVCGCGAAFDLDATPNFRDRIKESGLSWPPKTLIRYPAKDW